MHTISLSDWLETRYSSSCTSICLTVVQKGGTAMQERCYMYGTWTSDSLHDHRSSIGCLMNRRCSERQ